MPAKEEGETAIVKLMRKITRKARGPMAIQKRHVHAAIKTNAGKNKIGALRGDKIWAWVAGAVETNCHKLRDTEQWTQEWMGKEERELLVARGQEAWARDGPGWKWRRKQIHRMEMKGTIMTWIRENEEKREEGPVILRTPKLIQMLTAKKKTAKPRGGRKAIYATLTILAAEGEVILEYQPSRQGGGTDIWDTWVEESVEWMRVSGWVTSAEEGHKLQRDAEEANEEHQKEREKHLVIDIGEGWGSVRRTLQGMGVQSIGVDRRGFTYTGAKEGTIISAVNHDLTAVTAGGVLKAIAKKAGRAVNTWTMVWLSPECSPLSIANAINQKSGSAHGRWATTEKNRKEASEEDLELEREYLREAGVSTQHLMQALEAAPETKFALENPATSELWKMKTVTEAMERNPGWRKVRVDQCAYGRLSQKPTTILTNLTQGQWNPQGQTGNGRCKVGTCAGTAGNARGDKRHAEQTVPNTKEKRPSQGARKGGRWDFTKQAVVNAVAAGLVQEITEAAIKGKEE